MREPLRLLPLLLLPLLLLPLPLPLLPLLLLLQLLHSGFGTKWGLFGLNFKFFKN